MSHRYGQRVMVLNREGKEAFRLPDIDYPAMVGNAWIFHDGRWWGFGVGLKNGECHFYEIIGEPLPEQRHEKGCEILNQRAHGQR